MKSLAVIWIMIILTGCSINKRVTTQGTKKFLKEMQSSYEFIDSSKIYKMSGPSTLFVEYQTSEEVDKDLVDECFKMTQAWIVEEGTLDDIEGYLNVQVSQIDIIIRSKDRTDRWVANYYSPGPEGYQDNRYWTEDNIDGFKTWRHEID